MKQTDNSDSTPSQSAASTRRQFLGRAGGAVAATVAANTVGLSSLTLFGATPTQAAPGKAHNGDHKRANEAYRIRQKAAQDQRKQPLPDHPTNGDEERYANQIGSYSKALPHNQFGEVDLSAYAALLRAMASGDAADFNAIPRGGSVKQANPQAALAFELEGADSHHLGMVAPPAFESEHEAAEMAEVYWQALTRDVAYSQYGLESLTNAAIRDLSRFAKFSGVSSGNLFRGETTGDLVGPYISQFLWRSYSLGALPITQRFRTAVPGDDYMTSYDSWLNIQNGIPATGGNQFDPTLRYLRNARDLGEWDHRDFSYQGFLTAALILLSFGGAALDDANPYKTTQNQAGFVTFGGAHILDLVAHVANCGLKAAWYQKWSVHRRLRPEEFAGRVQNHQTTSARYPIHSMLLNSSSLPELFSRFGTYLLPMAYPEGCPTHPAYPAGHATIAGACVTVLKAFFKESFVIPSPVVASDDGSELFPYAGPTLTVGGELDKLASNVAIGRDAAGVHWRSDGIEGLNLGEAVAISVLRDYRGCFNERFDGFSLTKFDGTTITI